MGNLPGDSLSTGVGAAQGELAYLYLDGWAGRTRTKVLVIGETPKRYKIQALQDMRVPGRNRTLFKGDVQLVPKHAIRRPLGTYTGRVAPK